jgi:hypothetical protein
MAYFVISPSEDGARVRVMLPEAIGEWATDGEEFYTQLPLDPDTSYWCKNLIIKGEIVTPQPVKVVTEWELP